MKLLITASLLSTMLFTHAVTKSKFLAYSVSDIVKTADDSYTATMVAAPGAKPGEPQLSLTITTKDCKHVPTTGETGIVVSGARGNAIIFANGGRCEVTGIR